MRHIAIPLAVAAFLFSTEKLAAQGCPALATITLTVVAAPEPVLTQPTICPGGTAVVATQQAYSSYLWSNSATTPTITVSAAGDYSVTVTNAAGCTGTGTTTVEAAPLLNVNIDQLPTGCNGSATLSAGAGFSSYSWSNGGGSNPTATFSANGTYSVTVSNAQGCTGVDDFTLTIPTAPTVSITGNPALCPGSTSTLTATAGFSNYLWTGGATTQSIDATTAGTFSVTATNAAGCTATASFTTTTAAAPVADITGPAAVCSGQSATLTAAGGPFSQILWSNSEMAASISVITGGSYSVTVTNAAGCTGSDSQVLTINQPPAPTIAAAPYSCNGQLSLDAGGGFSSYLWSNAATTATTAILADGTYSVTVTDAAGCTGAASFTAVIPPAPTVSISGDGDICDGESSVLTASGTFPSYLWSNASSAQSITASAPGSFSVTATDGVGCTATASFAVSGLASPQPVIAGPSQICLAGSATFSVPGGYSQFSWSNSTTDPTITVSQAGTYSVTVTAANGCTGTASQSLTIANSLQPTITQLPYNCNGKLTLDAGAGFATYSWSNGTSEQTLTVSQSGTYAVTVSDGAGCSGSTALSVSIPAQPVVAITGVLKICPGSTTSLAATPGFQTYKWSNGATTATLAAVGAGSFVVTATDANGCTSYAFVLVENLPSPAPQIAGPTTICSGSTAVLSTSQPFQNYLWSTGATAQSITVGAAGTFSVTVSGAGGCTGVASQTVSVSTGLSPAIAQLPYNCDGQITLDAGPGFQTYSWSNGVFAQTLTASQSGTYDVTVSDAGGCTGTASLSVNVPQQPTVAISGNLSFCQNSSTTLSATAGFSSYNWSTGGASASISNSSGGNISVTATDGLGCTATASVAVVVNPNPQPVVAGPTSICTGSTAVFSTSQVFQKYLWSTGAATASITASTAGNFSVTVTDANGCTGFDDINLTIGASLSPAIVQLPYNCDGKLTLDAGAGYATYSWSNGTSGQTLTVSQSGTYVVTVSDGTGCTGSASQTVINIPAQPTVAISGVLKICPGSTTTLTATAGFPSYKWSNGTISQTLGAVGAGSFSVTATDANGCTATASVLVENLASLTTSIAVQPGNCDGLATLDAGAGFQNYQWSNGQAGQVVTVSQSGVYAVTVSDGSGCSGTATAQVTVVSPPTPPVLTVNEILCDGSSVTINSAGVFSKYKWSDGSSLASLTVFQTGNFGLTVTDANGCTASASIDIKAVPPAVVTILGDVIFCENNSTTLTASGSAGSFSWSNGAATASITASQSGPYAVTVTDANGCTASASTEVFEKPAASTTVEKFTCKTGEVGETVLNLQTSFGCDSLVTIKTIFQLKPGLALDLPGQLDGKFGQPLGLEVSGNFSIDSVSFDSPFALSCGGCLSPTFSPTSNGTISVTAFDADGCPATGEVLVKISRKTNVYVPNAIDFDKGGFVVFSGPELKSVRNFHVYDRWGESLFSTKELPTNDPSAGWDGGFRGQRVRPGVYVYWFEAVLPDGSVEVFKGDVTVVR